MERDIEVLEVLRWLAAEVDLQRSNGGWTAWACDGWEGQEPMRLNPPPDGLAHVLDMFDAGDNRG